METSSDAFVCQWSDVDDIVLKRTFSLCVPQLSISVDSESSLRKVLAYPGWLRGGIL